MPVFDVEDDGTKRCGVCGKLKWGWDGVCPICGADYRQKPYNACKGDLSGFSKTDINTKPDYANAAMGHIRAFERGINGES